MKLSELVSASDKPLSLARIVILEQLQTFIDSMGFDQEISIDLSFINQTPPDMEGDIAFACFNLAKILKKSPKDIAMKLQEKFQSTELFQSASAVGPYLNLSLDRDKFSQLVLGQIFSEANAFGTTTAGGGKKVMMEYSSPNTNKPQHLGHIRNNLLGWTVAQLLSAIGFDVSKTSIVNDRGIHICKSMLAYKKWGNDVSPETAGKKQDHLVGDFYVMFETELKKEKAAYIISSGVDPKDLDDKSKRKFQENFFTQSPLMIEAQAMLKAWENGDEEVVALWKKMNSWVYEGFNQTYDELGVDFTKTYYESDIYKGGRDIINKAVAQGYLIKRDDGSIVAPLQEKFGMPDKVVLRGDGTSLYITQDINLAHQKFKKFDLDYSIYCIANEQDLYMQQLINTLLMIGFFGAEKMYHMSYGMVNLPEGRMKSREGNVVDADDLMAGMTEISGKLLRDRYPDLSDDELAKRSKYIGLSAIKFFILSIKRASTMTFNPEQSIAFEGKTGPYLLYTFARANSVLKKAGNSDNSDKKSYSGYSDYNDEEWALIIALSEYHQYVYHAAVGCEPSILADKLYQIAQLFNQFYHSQPILKADDNIKSVRLSLTEATKQVLSNGLGLLGITTLDEM